MKQIADDEFPHDRWAAEGGKLRARSTKEGKEAESEAQASIDPRHTGLFTPDNVHKYDILSHLVLQSNEAEEPFAPHHPMKKDTAWRPHSGRAMSAKRDREKDAVLLPERKERKSQRTKSAA